MAQKADSGQFCRLAHVARYQRTAPVPRASQPIPNIQLKSTVPRGTVLVASEGASPRVYPLPTRSGRRSSSPQPRVHRASLVEHGTCSAILPCDVPAPDSNLESNPPIKRARWCHGAQAAVKLFHRCTNLSTGLVDDVRGTAASRNDARPPVHRTRAPADRDDDRSRPGSPAEAPGVDINMAPPPGSDPHQRCAKTSRRHRDNPERQQWTSARDVQGVRRTARTGRSARRASRTTTARVHRQTSTRGPHHHCASRRTVPESPPENAGRERRRAPASRRRPPMTAIRNYSRSMTIRRDGSRPWLVLTTPSVSATR